jgi:hypothetical protein
MNATELSFDRLPHRKGAKDNATHRCCVVCAAVLSTFMQCSSAPFRSLRYGPYALVTIARRKSSLVLCLPTHFNQAVGEGGAGRIVIFAAKFEMVKVSSNGHRPGASHIEPQARDSQLNCRDCRDLPPRSTPGRGSPWRGSRPPASAKPPARRIRPNTCASLRRPKDPSAWDPEQQNYSLTMCY